MSMTN